MNVPTLVSRSTGPIRRGGGSRAELARPVRFLFTLLLAVAPALASLPLAAASYPGSNGKLVLESSEDGDFEVFAINADGTGLTKLTDNTVDDRFPVWSADGQKIVWTRYGPGSGDIWSMNGDGSGATQLTSGPEDDQSPSWSPDGTKILFNRLDGDWEIFVMNADGTGVAPLTANGIFDCCANYSPDGTTIIYQPAPAGIPEYDIWRMNPDGTGQAAVNSEPGYDVGPEWAPHGSKILYARDFGFGSGWAEVMRMNPDGTSIENLTNTCCIWESGGAYSPDGTKIAFISNQVDPAFDLYLMDADGSNRTVLYAAPGQQGSADWQPIVTAHVVIDIKPGSDPNSINPKGRGVLPVAILTTGAFDAADVDPSTVRFGTTGSEAAVISHALEDVDKDGDADMILRFRTQETGLTCGQTSGTLSGETWGGKGIEGQDAIVTVGC